MLKLCLCAIVASNDNELKEKIKQNLITIEIAKLHVATGMAVVFSLNKE